jgi:ABC-type Zn uptake system ZnuABC Zn-binding protein ZnuA
LAGLLRPLAPPGATVQTLIPAGHSEHGYELTPNDAATLAKAALVVTVGLGIDGQVQAFLDKHPSPQRREVCFATVARIAPGQEQHEDHADDDGHHHGGTDPHLWLDPDLCITLIPMLAQNAVPVGTMPNTQAADGLIERIRAFDEKARATLAPYKGRSIVTHHAAWGRFAAHYGLTVAAVIKPIESAEETNDAIKQVVQVIRDQQIKEIFVEPQFSDKAARRIAEETGVRVGRLDPLGDGDWFAMMQANVDAIAKAFAK